MPKTEFILKCYRGVCNEAAHPCGYNRVTQELFDRANIVWEEAKNGE